MTGGITVGAGGGRFANTSAAVIAGSVARGCTGVAVRDGSRVCGTLRDATVSPTVRGGALDGSVCMYPLGNVSGSKS